MRCLKQGCQPRRGEEGVRGGAMDCMRGSWGKSQYTRSQRGARGRGACAGFGSRADLGGPDTQRSAAEWHPCCPAPTHQPRTQGADGPPAAHLQSGAACLPSVLLSSRCRSRLPPAAPAPPTSFPGTRLSRAGGRADAILPPCRQQTSLLCPWIRKRFRV